MLGVLIFLTGASSAPTQLLEATSSKPLESFGACFTQVAEHGNRAWAYMPGERGGIFTDSGARGTPASYWLRVRDTGAGTRLRLFSKDPAIAAGIGKAMDQCR